MKITVLLIILCGGLATQGCASASVARITSQELPSWVLKPCRDFRDPYVNLHNIGSTSLCVVGSAKYPAAGGLDVCRDRAYQNALSELSSTIKTTVLSEFRDYVSNHSGRRRAQTVQMLSSNLETSSTQIFRGLVARGPEWISAKGYCFVMIYTPRQSLGDIVFTGINPKNFVDLADDLNRKLKNICHHGVSGAP